MLRRFGMTPLKTVAQSAKETAISLNKPLKAVTTDPGLRINVVGDFADNFRLDVGLVFFIFSECAVQNLLKIGHFSLSYHLTSVFRILRANHVLVVYMLFNLLFIDSI